MAAPSWTNLALWPGLTSVCAWPPAWRSLSLTRAASVANGVGTARAAPRGSYRRDCVATRPSDASSDRSAGQRHRLPLISERRHSWAATAQWKFFVESYSGEPFENYKADKT